MRIKQYTANIINQKTRETTDKVCKGGITTVYRQEKDGEQRIFEVCVMVFNQDQRPAFAEVAPSTIKDAGEIELACCFERKESRGDER